ncbi:hypothetical protein ENUP19_0157G0008 [Entamoeba nuttalli]|uniref:Uncharacterized protein n=1 Tax=Entamoeba nuttalli TaxID=412467 RepID=A0ABQ0DLA1_9EUKA
MSGCIIQFPIEPVSPTIRIFEGFITLTFHSVFCIFFFVESSSGSDGKLTILNVSAGSLVMRMTH